MNDTPTHHFLIAGSIGSRDVFESYEASGESANAPEELAPFVEYLRDFYGNDSKPQCADSGYLAAQVAIIRDPKRREAAARMLESLLAAPPSIPNAKAAVRALSTQRVSESLATKLLIPSKDGPDSVLGLIDQYLALQSSGDRDDAPVWSKEAIAPALGVPRVPIYPSSLGSKMRGGLWPGHHMTVFARPEIGKSAFALNIACLAASRAGRTVLYLSNEDPVRDLMMRVLVRATGWNHDQVLADLDSAIEKAKGAGVDRIFFRDMSPGSLAEVDKLVRRYGPDLLVVDQMRNMSTGNKQGENMTQRLDQIAQGLRNIGKRHGCAVLSVTQAGDSARDKAILDDGDVDNSNTGISAGCDVLIGIGATPVMLEAGERRLSIIKNKLGGQHGFVDVRLDPVTLSFRDRM